MEEEEDEERVWLVAHARLFLKEIQRQFFSEPSVYDDFQDITKKFKYKKIDIYEVIKRVTNLFGGRHILCVGFNAYVPPELRIQVEQDELVRASTFFLPANAEEAAKAFSILLQVGRAMSYLNQVEQQFKDQPFVYTDFVKIMKKFTSKRINILEVIRKVANLFKDHLNLLAGFNSFLPSRYKIEVEGDVISILQRGKGSMTISELNVQRRKFKDVKLYLDRVKQQFETQPVVYGALVDILKEFQRETMDTLGVMKKVTDLFQDHLDLIVAFNPFLPPGYKITVEGDVISALQPGHGSIPILELNAEASADSYARNREKSMKIARSYLDQVKLQFGPQSSVCNDFLNILKDVNLRT